MFIGLILKVAILLVDVNHRQYGWFSQSNLFLQTRPVILRSHHVKVLNGQMLLLLI